MKHGENVQGQLDLFEGGGPRSLMPNADLCTSRHHGADTSVAAFQATPESTRQRQRKLVLDLIKRKGIEGATCEEASILLGIAYTAASGRCTELQRLELIHDSGERRGTTHGRTARVYRAGRAS